MAQKLRTDRTFTLATIPELTKEYRASSSTISRAIRLLAEQGLVESVQGTRIRRIQGRGTDASAASASSEALYRKIRQSIESGAFRNGERLPKFATLTAQEHVSRITIVSALRRLSQDLLIHKKGKSWIAGPRPPDPMHLSTSSAELSPTAFLVCTDVHQNTFNNLFLVPFLENLISELREKGIDLRVCFHNREPAISGSIIPFQGIEEVKQAIARLGNLYSGALITDVYFDAKSMREWFPVLSARGAKPVIFFDASNDLSALSRAELELGAKYYRMFFDETAAVRCALDQLAGHRSIIVPVPSWMTGDWVGRRTRLIKRIARAAKPCMEVIVAPQNEVFCRTSDVSTEWSRNFNSQIAVTVRKGQLRPDIERPLTTAEAREAAPKLWNAIQSGATAMVVLNDWLAHLCLLWCDAAGVRVPQDLSIVSFDNARQTRLFPLATVDFGFSRLGYLAARILCGTEPAEAGRNGNIPGVCTFVNRGSLARGRGAQTGCNPATLAGALTTS